jgi:uncharacterized ferredoxin-like protein
MPKPKVQYNVKKKISELTFWDKNPNVMEQSELRALEKSINKFGFLEPIIIDEKGKILGGNHRAAVMFSKEGAKAEVVCTVVSGLNEEEKNKLGLALNRIHGENDPAKLKELLGSFSLPDEILELGFTDTDMKALNIDLSGFSTDIELFDSQREIKTGVIICPHCGMKIEKTTRNKAAGTVKRASTEF